MHEDGSLLTISVVHNSSVRWIVEDPLCSRPIYIAMAFEDILSTAIRTACAGRIHVGASDGRTPTCSHFVLSASSGFVDGVAICLPFAPE